MHYRLHLAVILGAAAVIFGFNYFATEVYLYWYIWWLDILMHFVGGMMVGYAGMFFALLVWRKAILNSPRARWYLFFAAGIAAFSVGAYWEVLEHLYHLSKYTPDYVFDSISDIINDTIGGILTWVLTWRWFVKKPEKDSLIKPEDINIINS